jgi:HMG (high mobility group) box
VSVDGGRNSDGSPTPTGQHERPSPETKRKYRRHPKPDKNAPERPPSAYVIFSNKIREEVRGQNLSFTDIAKLVGDRWQKLSSEGKEPFESQANAAKEKFAVELAHYKKTDSYKDYTQYMADFKSKHGGSTSEGKRPKLEPESTGGSVSSKNTDETRSKASAIHIRDASISSISTTSYHGSLPSPGGVSVGLPQNMVAYGTSSQRSRISSSPKTNSPPLRMDQCELRLPPQIQYHGSFLPEHLHMRGEYPDLHSRTGQLSLAPTSSNTVSPTVDATAAQGFAAAFPPPPLQHQNSVSSGTHSDSSSTSNLPVTPGDEPWRLPLGDGKGKSSEWPRVYNPLLTNSFSSPFGQLPPIHPERVSDISRDPNQRTLPFPSPSSPHDPKGSFRARPLNATPMPSSESSAGSPSEPRDEMKSPLDNSENDAVNTLAVLAYTRR